MERKGKLIKIKKLLEGRFSVLKKLLEKSFFCFEKTFGGGMVETKFVWQNQKIFFPKHTPQYNKQLFQEDTFPLRIIQAMVWIVYP